MATRESHGNDDETTIQFLLLDLDSALLLMDVAERTSDGQTAVTNYEIAHQTYDIIFWRTRSIVDSQQEIRINLQNSGMKLLSDRGLTSDGAYPKALATLLHNSGGPVAMVADEHQGITSFALVRSIQSVLPVARVAGKLRAINWNELGLAAVVGESLVTWSAGSKNLRVVATTPSLENAKDVTLIGEDRAIVSFDFSTALFSPARQLVIVGAAGKCRYSHQKLYLLDERAGICWLTRSRFSVANVVFLGASSLPSRNRKRPTCKLLPSRPPTLLNRA